MIFDSPKLNLKVIRVVLTGDVNDVYICQDIRNESGSMYTVLQIKQHNVVHSILKIFEESNKHIEDVCADYYSVEDSFIMIFPYHNERPLSKYYLGSSYNLAECEAVCISLVINFMTNELPYPIMYLILVQDQLNMAKDKSIYLSHQIDFTDLDENINESNCVEECAKIVLKLLESKAGETNVMSYSLISKKIERHSYRLFTELYKDIRIAAAPSTKRNLITRLKAKFNRNKDKIFRIVFVTAIILGLIVALLFITNLIFGDIPWLRIFVGGFKYIGTENLAQ